MPPSRTVSETVEVTGHLMDSGILARVLDDVLGRSATVDTSDGDRLVGIAARGTRAHLTWHGTLDHGTSSTIAGGRGPSSMLDGVLLAGDRYTVRAHGNARVLVYRPE